LGGAALQINENENAICTQMTELSNAVLNLVDFHPDLPKLLKHFNSMLLELQEIGNKFYQISESTEHDDNRLSKVNERLSLLYGLLNKYHVQTDEQLIEIKKNIEYRLSGFEDLSNKIADLEFNIRQLEQQLLNSGKKLSSNRQKVTGEFQKSVHKLLSQLSMQHARLEVEVIQTQTLMPEGLDKLRFLFAANKGSRLEEINGIASGGELSRLALCIKSLVANAIPLPTLVFDEIDTGISGVIALQMGIILQELSASHQVISITHSPQIAAKAKIHYFVSKKISGNKTTTTVSQLNPEDRIIEIAKMLSGCPPSEVAKENARELLGC
jgi:DNA repair protein RecN (Recombination protein N)